MKMHLPSSALALLLTLTPLPAFAQDYDTLIGQALMERNEGNLQAAEDILWRAYGMAADKSEVSYLLGMVLAYQGLYTDALALIDDALATYPDDSNLQLARRQVLDLRAAPLVDAAATAAAATAEPDHLLTAGFSRSTIDLPGFADWNDRQVEYRVIREDGGQNYIRTEHNHRFDVHDTMVEGGTTLGARSALPLQVAIGGTPDADFMPEYFARVAAGKLIAENPDTYGALVAVGTYQHSSYANGRTDRLLAGFEYYLPGVDAWLTPAIGVVRDQDGEKTFAWTLGAHWQVNGRSRVGLNYSDAPETENLITTDTRVWGAYWQLDLGARWRMFLTYSSFERVNAYTRDAADMALQYRF